jgi:hypothetical protein
VAVNTGNSPRIPPIRDKPLREGYEKAHNLFNASLLNGTNFSMFFDHGCTNCYVSELLAKSLPSYISKEPGTISGVGGLGPRIKRDAVVTAQFFTTTGKSTSFSVTCGVVPDGTFPGDLTLGKSVFHKWGVKCTGDVTKWEREIVKLESFNGRPILAPGEKIPKIQMPRRVFSFAETRESTPKATHWGKGTFRDPKIQGYLDEYVKLFPGLFDPAKRRTDVLAKIEHIIYTRDADPVKLPPREYSLHQTQAIRDFISANLGKVIKKSRGPWASPILLSPKKPPGTHTKPVIGETIIWRMCTDYREVNKRTKRNGHSLPNAMDQIQRATGHQYYCFIDLKNGFWHIRIAEKNRKKSAFVIPFGLYEWTHMPFGLTNSSAIFQALMDEVLGELQEICASLFDDIVVWGDSVEKLHERVKRVFSRLAEYELMLNTKKSVMFVEKGVFLGFIVSINNIAADPDKMAAIKNRPMPSIITEIRAFVNAAGYFRHLISHYTELSSFLIELTGGPKNHPIKLSPEAQRSWKQIRELITILLVVRPFCWTFLVVIEANASKTCTGAVMLQPHIIDGQFILHPVAYFSKKFNEI